MIIVFLLQLNIIIFNDAHQLLNSMSYNFVNESSSNLHDCEHGFT